MLVIFGVMDVWIDARKLVIFGAKSVWINARFAKYWIR